MNVSIQKLGKVSITCNGEWENKEYDRLCLVNNGLYATYISKQKVPAGITLNNRKYWQPVAIFNKEFKDQINNDIKTFQEYVRALLLKHEENVSNAFNQYQNEINSAISEHIKDVNAIIQNHYSEVNNSINEFEEEFNTKINTLNQQLTNNTNNISNLNNKVSGIEYNIVKIDTLTYNLVDQNNNIKGSINIPQDTFLDNVEFNSNTNSIDFIFNTASGKSNVSVNIGSLVDTYTNGDGLNLSNNQFSLKIDTDSEGYLTISNKGIKLSGISSAINTVQNNLDNYSTSNNTEITNIKSKLNSVEQINNTQNTNITNLQSSLNSINTNIITINNKNSEQDLKLIDLEDRLKDVENNSGSGGSGEDYSDEIYALQNKDVEHDNIINEHETSITNLQNNDIDQDSAILTLQNKDIEHDNAISSINNNITKINTSIDTIENNISTINNSIETINTKNTSQDTAISNINTSINGINTSITNINSKNNSQDTTLSNHESRINSLESNVSPIVQFNYDDIYNKFKLNEYPENSSINTVPTNSATCELLWNISDALISGKIVFLKDIQLRLHSISSHSCTVIATKTNYSDSRLYIYSLTLTLRESYGTGETCDIRVISLTDLAV